MIWKLHNSETQDSDNHDSSEDITSDEDDSLWLGSN